MSINEHKYTELEVLSNDNGNIIYRLTVFNNQFQITKQEIKDGKNIVSVLLRYNDNSHSWIGVINGKITKIPAPSLRDIIEMINKYC